MLACPKVSDSRPWRASAPYTAVYSSMNLSNTQGAPACHVPLGIHVRWIAKRYVLPTGEYKIGRRGKRARHATMRLRSELIRV